MSERREYPAGVPCWVDTDRPDPEAALGFYEGLFGWEFEDRMPADAPGRYFIAELGGRAVAAVGSRPGGAPETPPAWNTYIAVDSADDAAAKVDGAGGSVVMAPFDVLDAGRMAVCADPSGAGFCVWQANETRGAEVVNEPGAWVFSELNTRDPERARDFYRTVFGWEAKAIEVGDGGAFTLWVLSGYGDFLERGDPDLRRRQAADRAPPGFEDAVATLGALTDNGPSHWGITFGIDDADAAAERAVELGGAVEVAPFDAGPTRTAVLSDPQGARFAVSKYDPRG
jgi:uncharacterized protein